MGELVDDNLQGEVEAWCLRAFGFEITMDRNQRNYRFLEEATELVQSLGMSRAEVLAVVDYVFDRPQGEPEQEVGGVMITLMALCAASGISLALEANTEFDRINTAVVLDKIRRKQAGKPNAVNPTPAKGGRNAKT